MWDVKDICHADEVGVLYRYFISRTDCTTDAPKAYKRLMDRMTAVITVFANGENAPLVIIGK